MSGIVIINFAESCCSSLQSCAETWTHEIKGFSFDLGLLYLLWILLFWGFIIIIFQSIVSLFCLALFWLILILFLTRALQPSVVPSFSWVAAWGTVFLFSIVLEHLVQLLQMGKMRWKSKMFLLPQLLFATWILENWLGYLLWSWCTLYFWLPCRVT